MGLCNIPDIFQEKCLLESLNVYIDDYLLIITTGSFEDHVDNLKAVLSKLREAGLDRLLKAKNPKLPC